ncbi:ubiquitin-conjugating enzyme E2 G1a isoform X1 [Anarhichas minor]|uniref:ubiquitin-conjugating enzyme E2 G1a isoform X1 n=1 Tax=Anarhichas minor TaxID=65739 RepID=UPI003F73278C
MIDSMMRDIPHLSITLFELISRLRRHCSATQRLLGKTEFPCLKELNKNPVEGFSAGLIEDNDLYRWEVLIIGPPDTQYEGGVFKAHLTFPKDYPLRPPKMKFITDIWHPNVDKNGDVCISILHEPGEDKYGYEKPEERWLPIHTVETIMISVISMLADPNGDSPANVDAAKEWREDRHGAFKRKVARCVRKSQETAFE